MQDYQFEAEFNDNVKESLALVCLVLNPRSMELIDITIEWFVCLSVCLSVCLV